MYKWVDSMTRPYFPQEFNYNINGLVLRLPVGHRLPFYQAKFPKYDKFLPFIAKRLTGGDAVIDIGANCGDTLASLVPQGPELKYYSVEPSDNYFKYLESNIETIRKSFPLVSITSTQCLVGGSGGRYTMAEKDGTATAVKIDNKEVQTVNGHNLLTKTSFDVLLKSVNVNSKLRLLKTDTDGSDWDVIDSGLEIIKETKPMIFFECDPQDDKDFSSYQSTFKSLFSLGYSRFYIFDNYGEYILSLQELNGLVDFMRYCFKQTKRTIFYIDIMASIPVDAPLIEAAINEYNQTKF